VNSATKTSLVPGRVNDFFQQSPEILVLIACAGAGQGAIQIETFKAHLARINDWDRLLRLADIHGILPLLAKHLISFPESVSPDVRDRLSETQKMNARHSLQLSAELARVVELMKSNGINVTAFKGPTLALEAYGDVALRQFTDLDFLISSNEVFTAQRILGQCGYRPSHTYPPGIERQLLRYRSELGMQREDTLVELQWQIAPRYFGMDICVEDFALHSREIAFGNALVRVLSPEDLLVVLCMHGSKHLWGRLIWVADVYHWIKRNPDMDWDRIMAFADSSGSKLSLFVGMSLAESLFGSEIAVNIRKHVDQDLVVADLTMKALQLINQEDDFSEWEQHRICLMYREGFLQKLKYLWLLATGPTEAEWEGVSIPPNFDFLYRVFRVGRVFLKGLRLVKKGLV
jgi:hypothetical protein